MIFYFFICYPLFAWWLVEFSFLRPFALRRGAKTAIALGSLVVALKFLLYACLGGSMFYPSLPYPLLLGWEVLFNALMILSGLAVLRWLCRGVLAAVRFLRGSRAPDAARPLRPAVAIGALVLATALAGHGLYEGLRIPDVREVTLEFPDLPASFDGYRIVHLSDLHVSSMMRGSRTAGLVKRVNALKGDVICITGDFVDGSVRDRLDDLRPVADLRASDGVFGCNGNHEYYSDYREWKPWLERLGVRMLDDSSIDICRGSDVLTIGGVAYPSAVCGVSPAVFAGASAFGFRIILKHPPLHLEQSAAAGARLQLSGHTHGGGLGFMRPLVAPYNENHIQGLYEEHGVKLYVSGGSGQWAGCPMRLGNPAEIVVITLRRDRR